MIYILEIVLSGLLGIAIGYLISTLFVKDYSLKGVMKVVCRFFNPLCHKNHTNEYIWAVMCDGDKNCSVMKGDKMVDMIDMIKCAMKKHFNDDFNTDFSIIPAAAFVLYTDELSYKDRCKAYRDVRDAIRKYKKIK